LQTRSPWPTRPTSQPIEAKRNDGDPDEAKRSEADPGLSVYPYKTIYLVLDNLSNTWGPYSDLWPRQFAKGNTKEC